MVAAYKSVNQIKVYIWEQFVGAAAHDPGVGYYVFAYDPEFSKQNINLAPLKMPIDHSNQIFVFPDLPELTYKRLPALLADSLPDDFGNALVDAYMATKGIDREKITPLDRLAYMGKRAMGALEFVPSRGPRNPEPTALSLETLVSAARSAVQGSIAAEGDAQEALQQIIDVGTSAGGARAKAVIALNPKTQEIRSGQLDVPANFEHWLLKFDGIGPDQHLGGTQGYGRIEYAYHLMARSSGIEMTDCHLLEENGRAHFMTKRFDRAPNGVKHHLQTLCAMDHLDYKKPAIHAYEQLFLVSQKLNLGREADKEIFRRMVFNIMAKNCDDHTKNTSFILRNGRAWELAPAYDMTFAYNPKSIWVKQHQMSVAGKFDGISSIDCHSLADRFGIGEAKSIIAEVKDAIRSWPTFANKANLDKAEADRIAGLHEVDHF